ncbi:MAG: UPF0262 family protein [Alphaproteobacteria bacterium]|nr:UPF0262 family protein [Alphaproteobacteria bacterium]
MSEGDKKISKKIKAASDEPCLKSVVIDAKLTHQHPKGLKKEIELAAADLMQHGLLTLVNQAPPPYRLKISAQENQLILEFLNLRDRPIHFYLLSLRPLARHFRDYQDIVLSHLEQARNHSRHRLEAIDMARRAIHNDAADLLIERLTNKITLDHGTARLLFTLLALLFIPHVALLPDFSLLGRSLRQHPAIDETPPESQFLFCCTMNSVRSPMALFIARHLWQQKKLGAAKWASAGVRAAGDKISLDPFVPTVLAERNIACSSGTGKLLDGLPLHQYRKIFALSPEAHQFLEEKSVPTDKIIYWPDISDPTLTEGSREQKLAAYRHLRDQLTEKLQQQWLNLT